jgi:predicted nucleotidyltransferase component of viral defense system
MIPKHEILRIATQHKLSAHVIEKDYVLGWLLAGITKHPELSSNWVFKGGTCIKKCYLNTYRFSEDLDFTVRSVNQINEAFLKTTFIEIADWIYEMSGLELPTEMMRFEVFQNPRGNLVCEGRIFYKGPIAPISYRQLPRIKLDLTVDEVIVQAPVLNDVYHEYSDHNKNVMKMLSYSYTELFAEKIRALAERTRPRDLYDVINLYHNRDANCSPLAVRHVLLKKCEFKNISYPAYTGLQIQRDSCIAGWNDQLAHQVHGLLPFEEFWNKLPEFFAWLNSGA